MYKIFKMSCYNHTEFRVYKDSKFICVIGLNNIGNFWFKRVALDEFKDEALIEVKKLLAIDI